jgi:hypothetical protein
VSNGTIHNILQEGQGLIKEWFFHWNHPPFPIANIIQMRIASNKIQLLQHPPDLLDLGPADYFLFHRAKEELADIVLTPESLKKIWKGLHKTWH